MANLDHLLRDTLLLAPDRSLKPCSPDFSIPEVPDYLIPDERKRAARLADLTEDEVHRKRLWHYKRVGLTKVEDVTVRHRLMGDMTMPVCSRIEWGPVAITYRGERYELPLTEEFLVRSYFLDGGDSCQLGEIKADSSQFWPLPTHLHSSFQFVFAYERPLQAAQSRWIKPDERTLMAWDFITNDDRFHGRLPAEGTTGPGYVAVELRLVPVRVAVCVIFGCSTERFDFDPGGLLGAAKLRPTVMLISNAQLDSAEASLEIARPTNTSMASMLGDEMTPSMGAILVTDKNDASVADTAPMPYWHKLFSYYLLDPADGETFIAVDPEKTQTRTLPDATQIWERHEYRSQSLLKVPHQGEFDNLHLAPRMRASQKTFAHVAALDALGRVGNRAQWDTELGRVAMAPFCAHDCLHTHWRWGAWNQAAWNRGWHGQASPNDTPGAPLVPTNQRVEVKLLSTSSFRQTATAIKPWTGWWQVFFHNAPGYAVSARHEGAVRWAGDYVGAPEPFVGVDRGWATYYWHLRFGATALVPWELRELIRAGGDRYADQKGRLAQLRKF